VLQVRVDRALGEVEARGDLPVGQAGGDQASDFLLPPGQPGGGGAVRGWGARVGHGRCLVQRDRDRGGQRQGGAETRQFLKPRRSEPAAGGVRRVGADRRAGRADQHRDVQLRPQRFARAVQDGGALGLAGVLGLGGVAGREQVERHRDRVQVPGWPLDPQAGPSVLDPGGEIAGPPAGRPAHPQRGAPCPLLTQFVAAPQALIAQPDGPAELAGRQAHRSEPGITGQRGRVAEAEPLVGGQRHLAVGHRRSRLLREERDHAAALDDVRGQVLVAQRGGQAGGRVE